MAHVCDGAQTESSRASLPRWQTIARTRIKQRPRRISPSGSLVNHGAALDVNLRPRSLKSALNISTRTTFPAATCIRTLTLPVIRAALAIGGYVGTSPERSTGITLEECDPLVVCPNKQRGITSKTLQTDLLNMKDSDELLTRNLTLLA